MQGADPGRWLPGCDASAVPDPGYHSPVNATPGSPARPAGPGAGAMLRPAGLREPGQPLDGVLHRGRVRGAKGDPGR